MKCPKCGTESSGKTVCGQCGAFLYTHTQNRRPMTRQQKRKETARNWKQALKGTLYAMLILIGFAIVLFLISILLGRILPDSMFGDIVGTTVAT